MSVRVSASAILEYFSSIAKSIKSLEKPAALRSPCILGSTLRTEAPIEKLGVQLYEAKAWNQHSSCVCAYVSVCRAVCVLVKLVMCIFPGETSPVQETYTCDCENISLHR